MSRPHLGYSNYYWIRQDQKKAQKKSKTELNTELNTSSLHNGDAPAAVPSVRSADPSENPSTPSEIRETPSGIHSDSSNIFQESLKVRSDSPRGALLKTQDSLIQSPDSRLQPAGKPQDSGKGHAAGAHARDKDSELSVLALASSHGRTDSVLKTLEGDSRNARTENVQNTEGSGGSQ